MHETFSVVVVIAGSASLYSKRWSKKAQAGDVFFFNPFEVHGGGSLDQSVQYEVLYPSRHLVTDCLSGAGCRTSIPLFQTDVLRKCAATEAFIDVLSSATSGITQVETALGTLLRSCSFESVSFPERSMTAVRAACDFIEERYMHAVSTDREHWEKIEGVVFYRPEGYSGDDFRDPEVFWVEQDQCYWLLIAAREDDLGGVVLKYTSTDLEHWELYGPIFAPMQQYMLECPDLFRMGDKWYLTYSWDCVTYYAMSDSIDGPFVAPRNNTLDGKGTMEGKGFIFYGGKTAEWHGNTYLCGWLGRAGLYTDSGAYDWAGSVMVHQLIQNPDGTLAVKAPDDLADYFNLDKIVISSALEGDVSIDRNNIALNAAEGEYALADLGTRPATMTLECDVTFDEDGRAGFAFGDPNAEEPYYTALCLDASWNMIHYEGYELSTIADLEPVAGTKFDFTEPGTHHVKLVCENEILVLYIDNLRALSLRVRNSTDGAHLCVFSYGCSASFNNILMKIPG